MLKVNGGFWRFQRLLSQVFTAGSFQSEGTNLNLIAISCTQSLTYFSQAS